MNGKQKCEKATQFIIFPDTGCHLNEKASTSSEKKKKKSRTIG